MTDSSPNSGTDDLGDFFVPTDDSGPAAVDPVSLALQGVRADVGPDVDPYAIVDLCDLDHQRALMSTPNHWELAASKRPAAFPQP